MRIVMRLLIAAQALLLAAIGLRFLVAPEQAAAMFFLAPTNPVGVATLRADMFGFFIGGSVFALYAAWRGIALPLVVPIVMIGCAILGRSVNIAVAGVAPGSIEPLAVELVIMAILLVGYRTLGAPRT